MNIDILGTGHLADTLQRAAAIRGFELRGLAEEVELNFVAVDVYDHKKVAKLGSLMNDVHKDTNDAPIIVLSQVPPGWTRPWGETRHNVFYQVDTIIMNSALERMLYPEQFVVGCLKPEEPLPLAYQEFLLAFKAPVLQMSYESAELAKLAINHFLTMQVETTCDLAAVAEHIDADWNDVARALHNDKRIGQRAYLRPGKINKHLERDTSTVLSLLEKARG